MIVFFFALMYVGVVLMAVKSPAERMEVARILSSSIIDPENARTHLSAFLICDSHAIKSQIIDSIC